VDRPPQILMTTSSVPAEGKTTIAISLAQNFSGWAARPLCRGDIRRRTFDAYRRDKRREAPSVLTGRTRWPTRSSGLRLSWRTC
jgi:hypothetical protein